MTKKQIGMLALCIAIPEAVGGLAGLLMGDGREMYQSLAQPPLSPPGWVFPVAWAILYALMGIASYLVVQSAHSKAKTALWLYAAQLAVNFAWSLVFFRFAQFELAVGVIVALNILVLLTMVQFAKINRTAAYLLIPYLLWLFFATYLNIGVAVLN